jgi:hypothetical protein
VVFAERPDSALNTGKNPDSMEFLDSNPGGQKRPRKIEKSQKLSSFEVVDVLF